MSDKLTSEESKKILEHWGEHLRKEHQLSSECEVINELTWFIGEAISGRVSLGNRRKRIDS